MKKLKYKLFYLEIISYKSLGRSRVIRSHRVNQAIVPMISEKVCCYGARKLSQYTNSELNPNANAYSACEKLTNCIY